MDVHCAGCAGCCLDWRPLVDDEADVDERGDNDSDHGHGHEHEHERRGPRKPLDDTYNLVAISRDEIGAFLEAGLGDALTVRLWEADADRDEAIDVDGHRLAAIAGRPAFFVGLRKPPKPVAPFGGEESTWLPTCVFLDPETLQCRIHGDDLYPAECAEYPAHNLALEEETECERVEDAFGGDRLLDGSTDELESEMESLLLGPQALGQKVFTHPDPETLEGVVDRVARGDLTREDRAEFVAVAAASSPGTLATSEHHYEAAKAQALAADSWVGRAIDEWDERSSAIGDPAAIVAPDVEEARGAPETPGWDDLEVEVETEDRQSE